MSFDPISYAMGAKGGGGGSGGGGAVEIPVDTSGETWTLTKTGQEILDYISNGKLPYVLYDPTGGTVENAFNLGFLSTVETDSMSGSIDGYAFYFGSISFYCASLDQYPTAK